jgi:hypothetical protein
MKKRPTPEGKPSAQSSADSTALAGIERTSEAPPTDPKPNTRPAEALALLLRHGILDQREFLDDAGGWRLADAIHVLRRLGWPIKTERVTVTLANGERARIARYHLDRAAAPLRQQGIIAPEIVGWLALAAVAFLLHLLARWTA